MKITNLEHSLQFTGVLKPTGLLQFGDHGGLCIIRSRHVLNQSLGQHLAVELLEHILVLNVLEDNHHLVQSILQLGFLWVFARFLGHMLFMHQF